MALGIYGRKCGMTRIFKDDGTMVPVTIIEAKPNRVTQIKTVETDGYNAVQVASGYRRRNLINAAEAGVLKQAGVETAANFGEFRLEDGEGKELALGGEIKVDIFAPGQKVDVTGTTIGKGFAGTIKRHHFGMGDATHGNSLSHRSPGSTGQRQTPGRVFKGKRMAGHMGNVQQTIQNLEVAKVDAERDLLFIKGAIPGSRGGNVMVHPTKRAG